MARVANSRFIFVLHSIKGRVIRWSRRGKDQEQSPKGVQALEALGEIGLEIIWVLQADVKAHAQRLLMPSRAPAHIERRDQAFITTPRIAHSEQFQSVEHGGDSRFGAG